MEEKKNGIISWVKEHKKQLLLAGISITSVIGIIIGLKNKDAIMELWNYLKRSLISEPGEHIISLNSVEAASSVAEEAAQIRSYTSPQKPFDVNQHIRNLSGGRHHSSEKAAEAAVLGIVLLPHQTIVDTYTKNAA